MNETQRRECVAQAFVDIQNHVLYFLYGAVPVAKVFYTPSNKIWSKVLEDLLLLQCQGEPNEVETRMTVKKPVKATKKVATKPPKKKAKKPSATDLIRSAVGG